MNRSWSCSSGDSVQVDGRGDRRDVGGIFRSDFVAERLIIGRSNFGFRSCSESISLGFRCRIETPHDSHAPFPSYPAAVLRRLAQTILLEQYPSFLRCRREYSSIAAVGAVKDVSTSQEEERER